MYFLITSLYGTVWTREMYFVISGILLYQISYIGFTLRYCVVSQGSLASRPRCSLVLLGTPRNSI